MTSDSRAGRESIGAGATDATVLTWRDDLGWDVSRGSNMRSVPVHFDRSAWQTLPATLQPGATELYRQFAESPDYLRWWAGASAGGAPGVSRFLVSTPAEHWERPWESTIAALEPTRWPDVAMARLVTGRRAVAAPQDVGSLLRVLVVQGREAGPGLAGLDLAAELEALIRARDSLDAAAKALVAPILARAPDRSGLVGALSEAQPTLLWLSGHATEDPPGFLLADGNWLTPGELAAAVKDAAQTSGIVPLYVVLWACKTGQQQRFTAPGAGPPFIEALADVGVSAALATLGPLADDIAPGLAAVILEAVALGRPLDDAVARGRAALMANQLAEDSRDDWACPVVWSVDLPGGEVTWSEAAVPAQRQSLARRLLPPGADLAELDAGAREQAETWSEQERQRVWVTTRNAGAFEVRSGWLSRVMAQQRINGRMVVVLDFQDFQDVSSAIVLRDWAERVRRVTDGFDDPGRQFRELAARTEHDPEAGWHEICHREDFTLALIKPREQDEWLWTSLRDAAAAVVLSDGFPPRAAEEGWRAEELALDQEGDADFDPLRHPLALGLAVLAFPAAAPDLADIDPAQVELLKNAGFLVRTRAGCLMPLSRMVSLEKRLDTGQFAAAHRTAFAMLDGSVARAEVERGANEALLQARLRHARLGGDPFALSTAAQQLMGYYRDQRRASALLGVFDQVSFRAIGEVWKISAGWAHLVRGSVEEARDLLEDVHDDELNPVEQAERLALMAEVEKSSGGEGSKARARELLEQALSVLESEPEVAVRVTRLRTEHDLARLTHFFDGKPEAAIPQYRKVSAAWQALPGHDLDEAITLRNLAEAEMTVASRGGAGDAELFDTAADDLAMARDRLPPHTGDPVAAELEYVAGRLALRRGEEERATSCFQRAKTVGLATNNLMLVAIVEARLFWSEVAQQPVEEYDPGKWIERATALVPYQRHAWAARVLINGNVRSARKLMDGGLKRAAVTPLLDARSLLAANPAFDSGSDRDRIVTVCAGLALTGRDQAPWEDLPRHFRWFTRWMADKNADSPETAWEATR